MSSWKRYFLVFFGFFYFFSFFSFFIFFMLLPGLSFAKGFDPKGIIDAILKIYGINQDQFQQMEKSVSDLDDLKSLSQQQLDDITGHYGYGKWEDDLQKQQWSPDSWDDALKGLSGGNPDRYQTLLKAYQQNHPTLSNTDYEKGASADKATDYQEKVQTNQAAVVQTTYAFNEINDHLKRIHDLTQQVDETQNMKAAMDLNSRILAENAYVATQEYKMLAVLNEQLAQENTENISQETQAAKFNTLPTE